MPRFLHVFSCLLLSGCLAWPALAQSDADDAARTVHVEGEAIVQVAPDQATVRLGIVTRAEMPQAARAQNGDASGAAMRALRDAGVPESQIRMQGLQLRAHRVFDEERRRMVDDGFEAVRAVQVTLNDLDRVPDVVAAVVAAGANRVQSVQYGLQDRTAARNEALSEAARDARGKAEQLAAALGAGVGAVRTIREQQFAFPRAVRTMEARASMQADRAEPDPDAYAPGMIDVEARVSVVFALTE